MPPRTRSRGRLSVAASVVALLAVTLLLMRNWLQGGLPISPRQETIPELAITWMFRQELLERRLLSEWNPIWFSGFPWLRFLSYPLYYVLAALSAWGGLSLEVVMVLYYVAVVCASGIAMLGYLRSVLGDWRSALVGAIAYIAFPYHNHVGVETWIHAAVWVIVPLFLWVVELSRESGKRSVGHVLLIGVVLAALPIVSSEYTILVAPFLILYLLARRLGDLANRRVGAGQMLGEWATIGAVALGACAFFVLPGLLEVPYVGIHAKHGAGSTFSDTFLRDYGLTSRLIWYAIARRLHLPASRSGLPGIAGSFWSVTWYPGLIVLPLAALGTVAARRRFAARAAVAGLLVSGLLSTGTNTPLNIFAYLPIIGRLSAFRGTLLVVACLCVLTGFGADWLLRRRMAEPLRWLVMAGLTAVILLDFAPASSAYQTTDRYFEPDERAAYEWLGAHARWGRIWEVATEPRDAYLHAYSLSELPMGRYGGYYDNGASLYTRQQLDWSNALATNLRLHQVNYVLLRRTDARGPQLAEELPKAGFCLVFERRDVQVWERINLASYANLYRTALLDTLGDAEQMAHLLPALIGRHIATVAADSVGEDHLAGLGRYAFVLGSPTEGGPARQPELAKAFGGRIVTSKDVATLEPGAVPEAVSYVERIGYDGIRLRVDTAQPGLLTIAESWYPHWRVRVDGRPEQVLRVNWAFLGVWLEEGDHRVEFYYARPWYVYAGYAMTAGTLLVLVLWWARHLGRARRERSAGRAVVAVSGDGGALGSLQRHLE